MADNEQQDTTSSTIDKATVKDVLTEVLSELPALKSFLEKERAGHGSGDHPRKDADNEEDKGKEPKDPKRKYGVY